jgi:hypothetical protein
VFVSAVICHARRRSCCGPQISLAACTVVRGVTSAMRASQLARGCERGAMMSNSIRCRVSAQAYGSRAAAAAAAVLASGRHAGSGRAAVLRARAAETAEVKVGAKHTAATAVVGLIGPRLERRPTTSCPPKGLGRELPLALPGPVHHQRCRVCYECIRQQRLGHSYHLTLEASPPMLAARLGCQH